MHLKNFAVLQEENGINLSPAFDLLNVNLLNPADDEELALTLNGKKKKIKLNDFVLLGKSLNIPQKAIDNSFKKFTAKNKEVAVYIESSFLNGELKEVYKKIWTEKQEIFKV
jgi:serine/threonine-protein kinase HipA